MIISFLSFRGKVRLKRRFYILKSMASPTNEKMFELRSLQSRCWWKRIKGIWVLRQMKVVEYIRTAIEVWEGCEQYICILSRSCLRRPAQTHVESLISVIGHQNLGQKWNKVLTEVQLRSILPSFHGSNALMEKMIKLLRRNTRVRALLKRPEA